MSTSQHPVRVLHVEDEPEFAELTADMLAAVDGRFDVETVNSPRDGLERLDEVECIVSDYDMPQMNGIEFLETVRETYPELPFILFTGKGSEEVAGEAISAGVTDYLQKAGRREQYRLLANRIRNAVQARREAKRAERQEQLMRLTEFTGNTGGFELDRASNTILLTDGTRRIIGRPDTSQIPLEDAIELFHPDDREDIQRTIERGFQTGEEVHTTWRLQAADNEERLLDITITPVTDNGEVTKLRGVGHDITDREERQRRLTQIETLFQHAQDSLFLIDVADAFTIERVSPAWEDATGVSAEQARGKTLTALLGEEQGAAIAARYRKCVERREPLQYEEQTQFDGEQRQWATTIAPVIVDGTVEYIAGSTRDITERNAQQRELRVLQQAINNATVSITLADPTQEDDPIVYVNDAFEELTGYPPEETLGRNCRFMQGEETDPANVATLREAITNEEPVSVELRNYRKDGTEFWNRVTLSPIYDDAGQLIRYLGIQEDITERKEREQELHQTRDLLSNMEQLADAGAWEYDSETETLMITDGARRLYGLDPEADLTLEAAMDAIHPDDRDLLADRFTTCLETGDPYEIALRLNTTEGTQRWINARGERVATDEDGSVMRGYIRDITEQRTRERELERYRIVFNELPDPVVVLDEDGRYDILNQAAAEIRAVPREELRGTKSPYLEQIRDDNPAEYDGLREGKRDTLKTELTAEFSGLGTRTLECRLSRLTDETGSDGLVVITRDITDRKKRERELTNRTKELEALTTDLEEQYRHLFEEAPVMAVVTRAEDGRPIIEDCNDLFVETLGYERSEVVGEALEAFYTADSQRKLLEEGGYDRALSGEFVRENRGLVTAAGGAVETLLRAVPREDTNDGSHGTLAFYIDISERKRLKQQRDRLEEFTSIVSHDLRSPLTVADGLITLAQEECDSDHLPRAADAIDRSQTLIDDLLTLAREGDAVTESEPVVLADVAQSSWETVRTRQATLETDATGLVQADRSRLQQLFENLFRNAIEHGGDAVAVRIGDLNGGFYVADTGSGIPESDRDEIFEAGYSTADHGTGFGLRIVEQIVEAHGWEISVTESEQGGARFEVTGVEHVE